MAPIGIASLRTWLGLTDDNVETMKEGGNQLKLICFSGRSVAGPVMKLITTSLECAKWVMGWGMWAMGDWEEVGRADIRHSVKGMGMNENVRSKPFLAEIYMYHCHLYSHKI